MNRKLKPVLLILGLLAGLLIISQLTLGMMILKAGGSPDVVKLVKAHQHTGYLTVAVVLIYVISSLAAIIATPSKPQT